MPNQKEIKVKLERIHKITGIKIKSHKIIDRSADSLIIEVNNLWIFRFPKTSHLNKKMKLRLKFLISFSKVSPLKIPAPVYLENDFIGYKKIPGKHLYRSNLEKLNAKDRGKIAKQFGLFLKALHSYKSKHVNFDTGYLIMRKKDYIDPPKEIVKHLNKHENSVLRDLFSKIRDNPHNFKKSASVIHGDLHFNNILWNPNTKTIIGVIDWAEAGLGIAAMDFIGLCDFSKKSNDKFLKEILASYGAKNDDLFNQIKEDFIIDVMNWFWWYEKNNQPTGAAKWIKKLKQTLRRMA